MSVDEIRFAFLPEVRNVLGWWSLFGDEVIIGYGEKQFVGGVVTSVYRIYKYMGG